MYWKELEKMTSKPKNPEEGPSTLRIIGIIFSALALPFLIIVAVLLNMENKNLGLIVLLLFVGGFLLIVGLIMTLFSHLPQEKEKIKIKTSAHSCSVFDCK